jgi:hypothetical protein
MPVAPKRPWTVPELAAVAALLGRWRPKNGSMTALADRLGRRLAEVSRKKREIRHLLARHAQRSASVGHPRVRG